MFHIKLAQYLIILRSNHLTTTEKFQEKLYMPEV